MVTTAAQNAKGSADARTHRHPQTHSDKLEDQAATAALYVTNKEGQDRKTNKFLDQDHKLSSAGAAASLKYANPQDLPSFPVVGFKNDSSAAGTAASLGWNNQKSFEHWKPDASPAAAAAAMLAKDYKMNPMWKPDASDHGLTAAKLAHKSNSKVNIWQPEASANGAKAALLAHKENKGVAVWKPAENDWGHSAANLAFKKQGLTSPGSTSNLAVGRHQSQLAATGAVSTRRRADSTPALPKLQTYPDEMNAAANALKAATSAAGKQRSTNVPIGGASPVTALSAAMYTSNPPVELELQEQRHDEVLQASAVAMAKSMYNRQQRDKEQGGAAAQGASQAHARNRLSTSTTNDAAEPMRYTNLQEAAQKLAHERLSKLHNEQAQNLEYRDYYGSQQNQSVGRRLTLRGRPRRRASSLDNDRAQSDRIRAQMSLFSSNLSNVDDKKRKADREALLAVAQRNVNKQMHGMDERVFADTGKVAPSLLEDWETKAQAAAQAQSESRLQNHGKVDIGGGKFVEQSEVDAVASRNVQPVLDDINEKAEINREKQAIAKAEQENNAKIAADTKAREKESKAINKKLAQQDKEAEKERKAEEKRIAKENRTSETEPGAVPLPAEGYGKHEPLNANGDGSSGKAVHENANFGTNDAAKTSLPTSMEAAASIRMRENAAAASAATGESSPMAPTGAAEGGRVKSWLKKRFSKRSSHNPVIITSEQGSKSASDNTPSNITTSDGIITEDTPEDPDVTAVDASGETAHRTTTNSSTSSHYADDSVVGDEGRGRSKNRINVLGKFGLDKSKASANQGAERSVSPLSEDEKAEVSKESHDGFNGELAPPPKVVIDRKAGSPAAGSRFRESLEEL